MSVRTFLIMLSISSKLCCGEKFSSMRLFGKWGVKIKVEIKQDAAILSILISTYFIICSTLLRNTQLRDGPS